MLALYCCRHTCPDLAACQIAPGNDVYPHTTMWDCIGGRTKDNILQSPTLNSSPDTDGNTAKRPRLDDCGTDNRNGDKLFTLFGNLPYEMKLLCLSHCTLHALFNTELWFRNQDPVYYRRLLADPHVTDKRCCTNDAANLSDTRCFPTMDGVDLNTRSKALQIGFAHHTFEDQSPHLTGAKNLHLDAHFGSANRYVSFYYRRCSHFDENRIASIEADEGERLERFKRLYKSTGAPGSIGQHDAGWLLGVIPQVMGTENIGVSKNELKPTLRESVETTIGPGAYYWEFINYNWEAAVAAIGGAHNRQGHFLLDPGAGTPPVPRDRIYMSLVFRRVAHPDSERDDKFENLTYFNDEEGGTRRRKDVYFILPEQHVRQPIVDYYCDACSSGNTNGGGGAADEAQAPVPDEDSEDEADEEADEAQSESDNQSDQDEDTLDGCEFRHSDEEKGHVFSQLDQQPIYTHTLTPTIDVRLYKCVDCKTRKNVSYYRATFPHNVTLHSLDCNKNSVRINFYMARKDMSIKDESLFGASLPIAVDFPFEGYAFTLPNKDTVESSVTEALALFNFFFP